MDEAMFMHAQLIIQRGLISIINSGKNITIQTPECSRGAE